ncbi:MAG: hypothetical protein IIW79_00770 [Clostridia bacterium]|nr:hypothetical protein [Clostridia bacterium]
MGKKQKRKKRMMPPKGASSYFSRSSDDEFKAKYPVGYKFLEVLGAVALLLPVFLYVMIVGILVGDDNPWILLGWLGAFIVGIGFFNLVAIIIDQYLGHLVTIIAFALGSLLVWVSLMKIGLV